MAIKGFAYLLIFTALLHKGDHVLVLGRSPFGHITSHLVLLPSSSFLPPNLTTLTSVVKNFPENL